MVNPKEKVTAKKSSLLTGQILTLTWILLGTAGCYLTSPLYGWLFLAFAAFSVYIIARRFMCNSCYYCKSCTKGVAKFSIMMIGGNNIPGLSRSTVLGLNIFLYIALTAVPGALLAASLMQSFSLAAGLMLAGLLAVTIISIAAKMWRGNKLVTS